MKKMSKFAAVLLAVMLCLALSVSAFASSGFNAGIEVTKESNVITVVVQDSAVLHDKKPTLTIPADAAFADAKVLFEGTAVAVVYENEQVAFTVAKGGTYYIVIDPMLKESVPASCMGDGRNVYVFNGEEYVEITVGSPDDHAFNSKASAELASAATCTEAARYYVQCDNCEAVSEDKTVAVGEPNGHAFNSKASAELATAATCTEAARYYVQCDNCDAVSEDKTVAVGEPNGHAFNSKASAELASAASCTEAARYYVQCDNCESVSEDKTVAVGEPNGHAFNSKVSTELATAATCTEAARYYVQCDNCDAVSEDKTVAVGKPNGHAFNSKASAQQATAATCTEAARYYVQCDNCDAVSEDKTVAVGEPNGHDFSDTKKETCANCSEPNPDYVPEEEPPVQPDPPGIPVGPNPPVFPDPVDPEEPEEPEKPEDPTEPEQPVVDTSSPTISTETEEKEDGSTVTTEIKENGVVVETTRNADGSTTTVATQTETKVDEGGNEVTVTVTQTEAALADGTKATTVVDAEGMVTAKAEIPAEVAQSGETVTLPVSNVTVTKDSTAAPVITVVTNNEEDTKVEIPVEEVTAGTVIVVVDEEGNETVLKDCVVTENGVAADLPDGAVIKVVDNSREFKDVSESSWHSDAVDFVSSRDLFKGVSDDRFDTKGEMTAGMLMTVLARLDGYDTTADEGEHWQQPGVDWAVEKGLHSGENASENITREEIAVMLWKFAGSPRSEQSLDDYVDFDENSSEEVAAALRWAVENSVMRGMGNGKLNQKGEATRAQVAQFLKNYIEFLK